MRRTRLVPVLLALVVVASGCLEREDAERDLRRFLLSTFRAPREFAYTEQSGGDTWTVKGRAQDDLKFQAMGAINGADTTELILSDDTLALRMVDPTKVPGLDLGSSSGVGGSQVVARALGSGTWVIDPSGAPPLRPTVNKEGAIPVGRNPMLDVFYLHQYLDRAIDDGADVWLFNPDDPEYKPSEDPFEKPKKETGVQRYDVRPRELPRRSQRGTSSALPATPHFRKLAFYVKHGRIFKIDEQIDYESHRDFKRAREGRGPKYPLELLDVVRAGRTLEPIRVRRMTVELSHIGAKVSIQIPIESAITASLGGLFGPDGVSVGGQVFPLAKGPETAQDSAAEEPPAPASPTG